MAARNGPRRPMRISAFDSSNRRPTRLLRLAAVAVAALALSAVTFAGRANAFVYWTSPGLSNNASGLLGRANLDGTNANDTFESSVNYPQAVAVDPADGYMYWTTNLLGGTIARASSMAPTRTRSSSRMSPVPQGWRSTAPTATSTGAIRFRTARAPLGGPSSTAAAPIRGSSMSSFPPVAWQPTTCPASAGRPQRRRSLR